MTVILTTAMFACSAFVTKTAAAQTAESEDLMIPHHGEKAGVLGSGELLATALKQANCEGNSVRLAMQSIGKLFNFHLSRAGDRYVYRLGKGRQIEMLRYQREFHIYEALLNPDTGKYSARVIELQQEIPDPAEVSPELEDESEIDVEQPAAMLKTQHADSRENQDISAPVPGSIHPETADPSQTSSNDKPTSPVFQNNSGTAADDELQDMEIAGDDAPVLPEDAALAGLVSPDEIPDSRPAMRQEYPSPERDFDEDYPDSLPSDNPQPDIQEAQPDPMMNVPAPEPMHTALVRPRRPMDVENSSFSVISTMAFISGLIMLLISAYLFLLPGLQARIAIRNSGMELRHILRLSGRQRIAQVRVDNQNYLISVTPDTMSLITPCSDDSDIWNQVMSNTYWQRMAGQNMPPAQLASCLEKSSQKLAKFKACKLPISPDADLDSDDDELDLAEITTNQTDKQPVNSTVSCLSENETDAEITSTKS